MRGGSEMQVPSLYVVGGIVCSIAICYILGSLPCGLWICKWFKGKDFDIRNYGSGNIGFTNVWKVLGLKTGLPVLVADIAKSFLPILLIKSFGYGDLEVILGVLAGGFGHGFSFFMYMIEGKFSGGKSVATFFGGFLAAQPAIAGASLAIWLIFLVLTRYMFIASIAGGVTALVASIVLDKGIVWNVACAVIALYLLVKHTANIGRWLHRTESKITEKRGPKQPIVAFVMHPKNATDMAQSPLLRMLPGFILDNEGKFSEATLRNMCKMGMVFECGEITGVVTTTGIPVRVLLMGVLMLPDQIQDADPIEKERKAELVLDMLFAVAVQAERRGASVLGLGGLLSTIGKGGLILQERLKEQGYSIVIDNGAAYTIAATLEAVEDEIKKPLSKSVVAVVGARGLIGLGLAQAIKDLVKELISVVRDKRAESDVKLELGTLLSANELSGLLSADLVISCTSSPDPIFTTENQEILKIGCLVLDVAYPPDFSDDILELRPDLRLVRCGLILLPGDDVRSNIDFGFGTVMINGEKRFLVPACLAQAVLLGITRCFERASRSARIRPEDIEFFQKEGRKNGLKVIISRRSEVQIYTGKADVK